MTRNQISRRLCFVGIAAFLFACAPMAAEKAFAVDSDGRDTDSSRETTPRVRDGAERRISDLRSSVEREIEQRREHRGKNTTEEKRKLECENRRNTINNKLAAFVQAAEAHYAKLNTTFDKVQAYQAQNMLPLANYQELVAATNDKRAAAEAAVATLKSVADGFDCTQSDTAIVQLGTVRDAAKQARQALHDYRTSIKEVVTALRQAQELTDSTEDDTSGAALAEPRVSAAG